jgi:type II secretory pathway pseudopilin PulG
VTRPASRRFRNGGFSLIEAIVFIVVLAVLLASLAVSFNSSLRLSPGAGQIDIAAELAQQRMELILAQHRAAGYAGMADPCPGPAACTPPAGYTVTSSMAAGFAGDPSNFKVVTVTVTGPGTGSAVVSALVANY